MIIRDDMKWVWGNVRRSFRRYKEAKRYGVPVCSRKLLLPYKNSDTLFVLGSASTINKLTKCDWKYIRSCDSIGLNFWPVHSFVPTFYMFELPIGRPRREKLLCYLNDRYDDYKNVPKIFSEGRGGGARELSGVMKNLPKTYILNNIKVPITNSYLTCRYVSFIDRLGLIDRFFIPSPRASIVRAVLIGAALGYHRLVLAGVELNNTEYFWDNWTDVKIDSGQAGPLHKTASKEFGELTADIALSIVQKKILSNRGIELEISSLSSALYPTYPLCKGITGYG